MMLDLLHRSQLHQRLQHMVGLLLIGKRTLPTFCFFELAALQAGFERRRLA